MTFEGGQGEPNLPVKLFMQRYNGGGLGSSLGESEHPVNPADLGPPQRNLGA
jgi:hypothetical protein